MTNALLVTQIVLWVVVITLGLVLLALARQLGQVLVRMGPLGGAAVTDEGPAIGLAISPLEVDAADGEAVHIPDATGRRTLLVFVSQSCAACADLIPALVMLARSEPRDLSVVLSTVPNADPVSGDFLRSLAKVRIPYVIAGSLAESMNVRGFPYAVVVSADGITESKGIVNNIVQLESLLAPNRLTHAETHHQPPAPVREVLAAEAVSEGGSDGTAGS